MYNILSVVKNLNSVYYYIATVGYCRHCCVVVKGRSGEHKEASSNPDVDAFVQKLLTFSSNYAVNTNIGDTIGKGKQRVGF